MKLTKKQQDIYNWLLNYKGYLKKSKIIALQAYVRQNPNILNKELKGEDFYFAFNQARIDYKALSTKNSITIPVKPKNALKALELPKNKVRVYDPNNVLIIGDTHFPFEKHGYLEFCLGLRDKYNCGTIVHIGDEVDNCAVSQYIKDPDGKSGYYEAEEALKSMKIWYSAFPNVAVCIGNHTARPFRLAHDAGLSKRFIKTYEQQWEAPKGWKWADSYDIHGVHYSHGNGLSGPNGALKKAIQLRKSCVIGHIHTEATVQYNVSAIDAIWGMQVGCGIDDKQYAFHYAKDNPKKSIISAGVVLEHGRIPIIELMKL